MAPTLAGRLARRETSFAAWCGFPEPLVGEACARAGFDAVVLDMQHGQIDTAAAVRAVLPIRAVGKPVVVRIPVGAYETASRMLDAGAEAIIAPMINSVADARAFAAAAKYLPVGGRSWGPTRAVQVFGLAAPDYLARANAETVTLAMIETRAALALTDEILAVDGIDGVFLGPSDLSLSLSDGAAVDVDSPETVAAISRVAAAAHAAGKAAAIYATTPAHARRYAALGFGLVSIASDGGYLTAGARLMLDAARGG
ncbi:HpcH/HpaI aldolase family protein [Methylobrevis albus]|uniref:2,4-dihydroxyhept-2-ene-1,7-dioic acid aldolase n=1 Tax=Methylobrevis albus TaxID=2793297 RepID=A0A931I0B8_9HYPH|nr:aldolase/citrate lyase family protein [Methylobrevis albus]MBH0236911.1 2,4-dihydroxyhept-2-ene-1,7-dioic acid aldolase [Methylobrevis albus]